MEELVQSPACAAVAAKTKAVSVRVKRVWVLKLDMGFFPILLPGPEQPPCQVLIRVRALPCRRGTTAARGRWQRRNFCVNGATLFDAKPVARAATVPNRQAGPTGGRLSLVSSRNSGAAV